jgi:DNA-binding HxlR family transcriptional regulator
MNMTVETTKDAHLHCVLDPGCASRRVFEVVSGRWGPLVIMALKSETKRHGELRRELKGISQKMLIQTLRNLEHNGLVEQKVYPVVPPRVEYSLTALGASLQPLLEAIYQWSEQHLEEVEEARLGAGQTAFQCGVRY